MKAESSRVVVGEFSRTACADIRHDCRYDVVGLARAFLKHSGYLPVPRLKATEQRIDRTRLGRPYLFGLVHCV
jgi:hypothetical protein